MTLRVPGMVLEEIRQEGERAYPAECCGLLAGRASGQKEVVRLVPMANRRTDDPRRYLISPDDLRRATAVLSSSGLEVLGFYHSHPDHPAAPSAFDVDHAWPWYSYIIVAVNRGRAGEIASWKLEDDGGSMRPELLDILTEV
ncbi:MAG TPA: M67 family metallopeptidase [Gemmatimonadales bacterium]|nr:M67 family metallopeptidase [Gemmatimonadales bacterium]